LPNPFFAALIFKSIMTRAITLSEKQRISSIDILRGLIMLSMALDHTRDFFHLHSPDPTNLAATTPVLFFTRWITHFCAALFVFLSGISAYLAGLKRTRAQLSGFLIKRGLWLIVVEFIFITFAFSLDPLYHALIFQVIWAIGVSMVILGVLVWLPLWTIGLVAILLFFGHDLLDHMQLPTSGAAGFLWKLWFTAAVSVFQADKTHVLVVIYAILPWTGVMLAGYVTGQVYSPSFDQQRRRNILLIAGIALCLLFVILRVFNIYGDPAPWTVQRTSALSVISFFNVSKYPPSLLYLCMTIGPGLWLLALIEKTGTVFSRMLVVYGNVPLFYYLLHFYLLRLVNIILFYAEGFSGKNVAPPGQLIFRPAQFGVSLTGVYLIWLMVIIILYFPCRGYGRYKRAHHYWWLSYL
jgi:uncharacterized membrane protein